MEEENKKCKRKFISLEFKVKILDRIKNGERVAQICRALNLHESTVRTIKKNEKKIRSAFISGHSRANETSRSRPPIIVKTEKALWMWIDECSKKSILLNGNIIKKNALKIYDHFRANGECSLKGDFVASKGWFERFKKRFSLHDLKFREENSSNTNTNDNNYTEELDKIIDQCIYTRNEIEAAEESSETWENNMKSEVVIPDEISTSEESCEWWENNTTDEVRTTKQNLLSDNVLKKEKSKNQNIDDISLITNPINLEDELTEAKKKLLNFTEDVILEGLELAGKLEQFFVGADPVFERSSKFKKDLEKCLLPYRKLYKKLHKKQTHITDFFQRSKRKSPIKKNRSRKS